LLELWRALMDLIFVLPGFGGLALYGMAANLRQGNPSQAGVQRGGVI
jgi:hypothetical protein